MKTTIGLIILAALCLGLGVALFSTRKQAADEKQKDTVSISSFSNRWVETDIKLQDQKQVNGTLEKDMETRKQQYTELTNKFVDLTNRYSGVANTLAKTENSLKVSQEELAQRDEKIAKLEKENHDLDRQAAEYSLAITNLTIQIADTQGKLARSEGDKVFLEKELKRLMEEKAELERKFNDLVIVRAQVAKLREELNISRRLEWIRKGLFAADEQKGAQRLMQKELAQASPEPKGRFDLNVEVNADGSVRVLPARTNAPAPPSK